MKALIWLPAACLAGIVIGAWGPREELRTREEHAAAEKARPRNAAEGFKAFARLANIPDEARRPHRHRQPGKALFTATNAAPKKADAPKKDAPRVTSAPATAPTPAPVATNAPPRRAERMSPEDLRARIEEAQDLWRTRVELARTQWKDKLGIASGSDAASRFDAAIDSMNEQLHETMQTMATLLAQQERMTPELGLRMVGDATTIMTETYEQIRTCVPEEHRSEVADMQVVEFIDPGVAEPLIEVQDKLEQMPMPSSRRMNR